MTPPHDLNDHGNDATGHDRTDAHMTLRARLLDVLLYRGSRPFDAFSPPADMRPDFGYPSLFSASHRDLAAEMVQAAAGSYIVELGSYTGLSALTFARAAEKARIDTPIVCVDTWLGAEECALAAHVTSLCGS